MAPVYRVIISPEAGRDLQGIYDWIARDSIIAASDVVERLLDEIEKLREFPQRYAVMRTRRRMPWPLRRMPARPYRILYWIEEQQFAVRIIAVRHGRQRPWP
jgi:plasmid stabilization system protein ParE